MLIFEYVKVKEVTKNGNLLVRYPASKKDYILKPTDDNFWILYFKTKKKKMKNEQVLFPKKLNSKGHPEY